MKKVFIMIVSIILTHSVNAQTTVEQKSAKPSATLFSGGIWLGSSVNQKLQIIGLIGPKLSVTFPVSKKTKIETGVMGVPGLIIDKGVSKLGLSVGTVVIIKTGKAKVKPVFGCMFIKTDKWHTLYGIGIQF